MLITYRHSPKDSIPNAVNFEPHIVGVIVTDHNDFVYIQHEKTDDICITVGKHQGISTERATLSWGNVNTKRGGDVKFAEQFCHCLQTAISIATMINYQFKLGVRNV